MNVMPSLARHPVTRSLVAGILGMTLAACGGEAPPPQAPKVSPSAALAEHSKEFRQELIQVAPGVHVAVGYGIANSILLEGTDGFIVVDTMESVTEGAAINALFRKIVGGKPLKAIIYTHNHPDHTFGAAGYVQPGEQPAIYAHEKVNDALDSLITEFRAVIFRRSLRMYGFWLDGDALGNVGIGPYLAVHEGDQLSILRPTRTFKDTLEDTVAGIHFELHHAPGETDDTLFVWLPEKKILLSGDNFYKAFPNLYTIRGTTYRNPRKWADSLDKIRAVRPEFLVPSHSRPLKGADTIYAALTDYRDAIRYVYDQTVRGMNAGLTADEIASTIKLPPHLAQSPNLQEFYGKPSWSSRMIFEGSVGWFDGDPAHLQPLPPLEQAQHIAALAGGADGLRAKLDEAVGKGDWQWALELSGHVLRLEPGDAGAKDARVQALTALGEAESNPNARHYYLMSAIELKEGRTLPSDVARPTPDMLRQMPLTAFFTGMAVSLNAVDSAELNQRVGFEFPDTKEAYTLWIRRGVCELVPGVADDVDMRVKVPAQVFKETLARLRNPAVAIAKDFEVVKGNKLGFIGFMKLFRPPDVKE
jgi:alkyl sulfatase BDS1-like metallo-beta-lactamase superfamily hydrolase